MSCHMFVLLATLLMLEGLLVVAEETRTLRVPLNQSASVELSDEEKRLFSDGLTATGEYQLTVLRPSGSELSSPAFGPSSISFPRLRIDAATLVHDGEYRFRLIETRLLGNDSLFERVILEEVVLRLVVLVPPQRVQLVLSSAELGEGDELRAVCRSMDANPRPDAVAWTLRGSQLERPLDEFASMPVTWPNRSTESVLHVAPVDRRLSGVVTCRVSNEAGSAESSATLRVLFPPRKASVAPPAVLEVLEGASGRAECSVAPGDAGEPAQYTYTWSMGEERHWTGRELLLPSVDRSYGGKQLECVAANSVGRSQAALVRVLVLVPPQITGSAVSQREVDEGRLLELTCRGEGVPRPDMQWWRNGALLADSLATATDCSNGYLETRSSTLLLTVRRTDKGNYTCRAVSARLRADDSQHVTLRVLHRPVSRTETVRVSVPRGQRANLSCTVEANPAPQLWWSVPVVASSVLSLGHDVYVATALLERTTEQRVSCQAKNSKGETTVHFVLHEPSPPEPVSNVSVQGVSFDSASLRWLPGYDGGEAQRFVVRCDHVLVNSSRPSAEVASLPSDTDVACSVFAANPLGLSTGVSVRVRTLPRPGVSERDLSVIRSATFQADSHTVSVELAHSDVPVCIRVERHRNASWEAVGLCRGESRFSVHVASVAGELRVSACLREAPSVCGPTVGVREERTSLALSAEVVIGVCVSAGVLLALLVVAVVCCRLRRRSKPPLSVARDSPAFERAPERKATSPSNGYVSINGDLCWLATGLVRPGESPPSYAVAAVSPAVRFHDDESGYSTPSKPKKIVYEVIV